tara:strand:- start:940 stop:1659 length:720 start_codon:yes stop_codon:yes gene_type:complete
LITVIVVTLNAELFIDKTISSILNSNLVGRVIIKDGGSKDETLNIIKKYNDPRLEIFCQDDKGIYDAMNQALIYVNNDDYFCFINAGDLFLLKNNTLIKEKKYDVIIYTVIISDENKLFKKNIPDLQKTNINIHHQGFLCLKKENTPLFSVQLGQYADLIWMEEIIDSPNVKIQISKNELSMAITGGWSDTANFDRLLSFIKYCRNKNKSIYFDKRFYKGLLKIIIGNKIKYLIRILRK